MPPSLWSSFRSSVAAATGIAAASGLLELGLRPFRSAAGPPTPYIALDSFSRDTIVQRQIEEGISVARFSSAGARLTGNPPLPGAPTVVILGDSYVVARAVADDETMGSHFERIARGAGSPVNVRQYGWSGASPSRYLVEVDTVLRRWSPADVVIVLSDNDLDANALYAAVPRLRVTRAGRVELLGAPPTSGGPGPRSVLLSMLEERTWEFRSRVSRRARLTAMQPIRSISPPPALTTTPAALSDSAQLATLPGAVVRTLSAAFGSRLALLYLAEVRLSGDTARTPIEQQLLTTCRAERVRCISTRDAMIAARSVGRITRGFSTTTPGNGHLNPAGHEIAGELIWCLLHSAPTDPASD